MVILEWIEKRQQKFMFIFAWMKVAFSVFKNFPALNHQFWLHPFARLFAKMLSCSTFHAAEVWVIKT